MVFLKNKNYNKNLIRINLGRRFEGVSGTLSSLSNIVRSSILNWNSLVFTSCLLFKWYDVCASSAFADSSFSSDLTIYPSLDGDWLWKAGCSPFAMEGSFWGRHFDLLFDGFFLSVISHYLHNKTYHNSILSKLQMIA